MPARTNAVLCDSIHQEDNGKHILVGVISGEIATSEVKFQSEYCLFVNMYDIPPDHFDLQIQLINPDGNSSISELRLLRSSEVDHTVIQINGIPLKTSVSGLFKLNWRWASAKRWTPLTEISVEVSAEFEPE